VTANADAQRIPSPAEPGSTGTSAAQPCDTLYFDGQCPLCAAEINRLREERGDRLALADIHGLTAEELAALPDRETLLRTLHLRRADGSWLRGADANVAAWDGTAQGRWLSLLRLPLLRHAVDVVYSLWAQWRYRRLYGSEKS
jgi:predicted DCC family thiol-disulfide oxidoreductase YuxK